MSGHHTHIRSAYFNNCYLRLDGQGVTRPLDDGGGTANCQFGIGPYETFSEVIHPDQSRSFRSLAFGEVWLRMDARTATAPRDEGSGVVNGQFGDRGASEHFKLLENADKTWSLMSTTSPNVFLRMDGRGVDASRGPGGGRVNCQYIPSGQPGNYEKFAFEHCIEAADAEAQLREIAALFPNERARIEQNKQTIVRKCCPPFVQERSIPSSVLFERPMMPAPREVFSPCQDASIDVGLNAIGLVLGLFGLRVSSTMRSRILRSLGRRVRVLVESVQRFYTRWVGGALEKAKAFYELVKDLWTHLNLREIMLDALNGWAWWEWILLAVRIGAEVAAWIASEGALLLVKIVLIVLDAVDLGRSIATCQRQCAAGA